MKLSSFIPARITRRAALIAAGAFSVAALPTTHAATWYWIGPNDQSPTNTLYWNSMPTSGMGQTMSAAGASFNAADIYDTNTGNKMLVSGNFTTGLLRINGSTVAVRNSSRTITNLEVDAVAGGLLAFDGFNVASNVTTSKFTVTNLNLPGTIRFHNAGASGSQSGGRIMNYQITNVTGAGMFRLTGALSAGERSTMRIAIADQELINGFSVEQVNVRFDSNITTTGMLSLSLMTAASLDLNGQSVTFSSITDGSKTWDTAGSTTVAALNEFFDTDYFTGAGSISISAIPEPSTFAFVVGALSLGLVLVRRRG